MKGSTNKQIITEVLKKMIINDLRYPAFNVSFVALHLLHLNQRK